MAGRGIKDIAFDYANNRLTLLLTDDSDFSFTLPEPPQAAKRVVKTIVHERDPKTNQIISSRVVEELEEES